MQKVDSFLYYLKTTLKIIDESKFQYFFYYQDSINIIINYLLDESEQ